MIRTEADIVTGRMDSTERDQPLEHKQQLVGLRVAIWSILLAALVGIVSSAGLSPLQRELTVNPSHSITDLAYFHPIHTARYGIYVVSRDLAPGATIILPPNHILDVPALESISHATVHIVNYNPAIPETSVPPIGESADREGVFEGGEDHRGVFARYAIGPGAEGAERVQLWTVGDVITILPEAVMEPPP